MAEKDEEYQFLITRAKYHQRMLEEEKLHSQKIRKTKYLSKFLTCANHKNADKDCAHCLLFPVQDHLANARLPTKLQAIISTVMHCQMMIMIIKMSYQMMRQM